MISSSGLYDPPSLDAPTPELIDGLRELKEMAAEPGAPGWVDRAVSLIELELRERGVTAPE